MVNGSIHLLVQYLVGPDADPLSGLDCMPLKLSLFIRCDIQERTQTMSVRVKGRRHARSYVSTYVLLIGNWVTKAIPKPGI